MIQIYPPNKQPQCVLSDSSQQRTQLYLSVIILNLSSLNHMIVEMPFTLLHPSKESNLKTFT